MAGLYPTTFQSSTLSYPVAITYIFPWYVSCYKTSCYKMTCTNAALCWSASKSNTYRTNEFKCHLWYTPFKPTSIVAMNAIKTYVDLWPFGKMNRAMNTHIECGTRRYTWRFRDLVWSVLSLLFTRCWIRTKLYLIYGEYTHFIIVRSPVFGLC
jgi:hypothetical protein